jgi:hypothetical protein
LVSMPTARTATAAPAPLRKLRRDVLMVMA